jgi:3-oxoacyl-[acyl-carrier protein] reductase
MSSSTAHDPGLSDRRALVTGAGQGVGEAIARELAAAGCTVLINDYFPDRAAAIAKRIVEDGGSAISVPFDVTEHEAVAAAVATYGGVDVLVNNAGNAGPQAFGTVEPFVETKREQWTPYIDVNVFGVMNCTHAALPAMIDGGWGRVITIVSDAGRTGGANFAAYSAAKAAAAGFSRAVAREVAKHGVTCNTIALGTMRTPLTEAIWTEPEHEDLRRTMLAGYLVRRPGEPDDVAWMVLTLASPRASWVTGQTIPVNGGFSFAQ